jgi:CysZ protein
VLAVVLMLFGFVVGIYLGPWIEARVAPAPGSVPVWVDLPLSLLLWTATLGSGVFLGLGIALALAAPLLDRLSRQVEARARGGAADSGRGLRWEAGQAVQGSLYFLAAAPGVFLLGFIPVIGPFLSVAWGAGAVAFQMTDPALTRRGLSFADKRRWHRAWRAESMGFGLAGMVGLLVPLANLVLGPALVAGGTLLVLDLEDLGAERPRPAAAGPGAETDPTA